MIRNIMQYEKHKDHSLWPIASTLSTKRRLQCTPTMFLTRGP